MDRKHFLRALGLITATATLPIDKIANAIQVPEIIAPAAVLLPLKLRLMDIVVFEDGTQAIITMMGNTLRPICELIPLEMNKDLGNGCGMAKEYDATTLPDIVQVLASCVGESSRNV